MYLSPVNILTSLQKISYKNNNNAWNLEDGVERRKIKRTVTSWIPLVDK